MVWAPSSNRRVAILWFRQKNCLRTCHTWDPPHLLKVSKGHITVYTCGWWAGYLCTKSVRNARFTLVWCGNKRQRGVAPALLLVFENWCGLDVCKRLCVARNHISSVFRLKGQITCLTHFSLHSENVAFFAAYPSPSTIPEETNVLFSDVLVNKGEGWVCAVCVHVWFSLLSICNAELKQTMAKRNDELGLW